MYNVINSIIVIVTNYDPIFDNTNIKYKQNVHWETNADIVVGSQSGRSAHRDALCLVVAHSAPRPSVSVRGHAVFRRPGEPRPVCGYTA